MLNNDSSQKSMSMNVGSCRGAPKPWQGHRTREEPARQLFLTRGCAGGPMCPLGSRRVEKGTCKAALPSRLSWGAGVSLSSFLLLLGFLLIFGNIIYSNKASLEKSKPFWKCSWLLWLRTWPQTSTHKRKGHRYSLAACLKDYNVLE